MGQAIISIRPAYGELVLSGSKTVELRNRIVRIDPGTTIWLYFTLPIGKIVAQADVSSVVHGSPPEIWKRFSEQMCIDRSCFDDYVGGRGCVSALVLTCVKKLATPVPIGGIRRVVRTFHPPEFYARIVPESPLFRMLNSESGTIGTPLETV